jgi:hypothetical protein
VRRTAKEKDFTCLHTRKLNYDPLENTSDATCSYCGGCNSKANVGEFVDDQKTNINDLDYRGLCGTNCKDDGATLLDNCFKKSRVSKSFSKYRIGSVLTSLYQWFY